MPTFAVYTNLPNDKVPGDFLQQASAFLANRLGKPESVCCHFFLCVLSRLNMNAWTSVLMQSPHHSHNRTDIICSELVGISFRNGTIYIMVYLGYNLRNGIHTFFFGLNQKIKHLPDKLRSA